MYECPECKSSKVKIGYPNITCMYCGYSEPLIDFPISYDYHRALNLEINGTNIEPCYPKNQEPEPVINRDVDENGYVRIRKVEDGLMDLRVIMTNLYRKIDEGLDLKPMLKTKSEKESIEESKQKSLHDLINKSRVGK